LRETKHDRTSFDGNNPATLGFRCGIVNAGRGSLRPTDISLASSTLPECWRASGKQSRANYDLTPHETRLLKLFVQGHNYKTAAAEFVRIGAELSDMELRRTK